MRGLWKSEVDNGSFSIALHLRGRQSPSLNPAGPGISFLLQCARIAGKVSHPHSIFFVDPGNSNTGPQP